MATLLHAAIAVLVLYLLLLPLLLMLLAVFVFAAPWALRLLRYFRGRRRCNCGDACVCPTPLASRTARGGGGRAQPPRKHELSYTRAVVTPCGAEFLAATSTGGLSAIGVDTLVVRGTHWIPNGAAIVGLAVSPSGGHALATCGDGRLRRVDVATLAEVPRPRRPRASARGRSTAAATH